MTPPAPELKPCPFCGGEADERKHSKRFDGDYVTSVGCCARAAAAGGKIMQLDAVEIALVEWSRKPKNRKTVEYMLGFTQSIENPQPEQQNECHGCKGTGTIPEPREVLGVDTCPACDGTGKA